MTTSGPNYAGTASNYNDGSTVAWTDVSNATGSNSATYAYAGGGAEDSLQVLRLSNFGFSIPDGSTIDGIQVEVYNESVAGNAQWETVKLLIGGVEAGSNLSDAASLSIPADTKVFGDSSELWGLTPSVSDVNDSGFGISLDIGIAGDTARISWARITITYTEGASEVTSINDNVKTEMRVNGTNINLGYVAYENTAYENYGIYPQSVSISGFPSGDFSLFVNTDAPGSIYTNDFSLFRHGEYDVTLSFYNNSGDLTSTTIDISDYNTNDYTFYKGCLLTYRNSIFNYYYLDSDGFKLCYTSPSMTRRYSNNILTIDGNRSYQYEQPYSLNHIGIASSGISSSQISTLEDWLINTIGQLPTDTSASYTSSDFHTIYSMPNTVSGYAGRLNGMIGDLAYISGFNSLYQIPEDSMLYMEAVVEYTGDNPSGVFLSPSISKNNNGYTNIWSPDNLRILPSSGIHKVRFSDVVTDTSAYPLKPSQFEFRTYSENCASGYRGGKINLYAMNFYVDLAYCLPPTAIYENMLLFTSGGQVSYDNVDLYAKGSLARTSGVDLFLKTTELSSTSGIPLFIEGGPYNDNIPLYLENVPPESGTNSMTLFIPANSGMYKSFDIYLESDGYPGIIPLYLSADSSAENTDNIPLYLHCSNEVINGLNLYVANSGQSYTDNTTLFVSGDGNNDAWNPYFSSIPLYIARDSESTSSSLGLYIGASGENNSVPLYAYGGTFTESGVHIYISGAGIETDNVKMYVHGY